MRILIDRYVPFLQGVLDELAEVVMLEPEQFTPARVKDADALIVRTRTRCSATLLDGSRVQFIATATIGTDHIDLDYCQQHGIRVVSCPGCNAKAVCDYIEEALIEVVKGSFDKLSIGVVGLGNVGKRVYRMARSHGMRVVINDPLLKYDGDVTQCDIITFHTPLTYGGEHPTWHMCDEDFLSRCNPDALIINAARGGVVDEQALLRSGHPFIIDTWEGEPKINRDVLENALLASYHIAGYSVAGKRNASRTCLEALCEHFKFHQLPLNKKEITEHGDSEPGWLKRITAQLKANPGDFEQLRKEYKLR